MRTGGGFLKLEDFLERSCAHSEFLNGVGLARKHRLFSGNGRPLSPVRGISPTGPKTPREAEGATVWMANRRGVLSSRDGTP